MKVILTRDYEKLGTAGEQVTVKDGFAKNFLMPNNIALPVTKGNIRQMEIVKKSLVRKEAKNIAEAQQIQVAIEGLILKFKVNSSPEGKLYGSITNKDIAEKIFALKKIEVDRKKIDLDEHIKEVGSYDIEIKLYKEVKANIKVEVKSDDVVAGQSGIEEAQENPNEDINGSTQEQVEDTITDDSTGSVNEANMSDNEGNEQ